MSATRLFVPGLVLAVLAGTVARAAATETDMLLRERCHKGECAFTKIINKRTVEEKAAGHMVEVRSRSVVVPVPDKVSDPATMPAPDHFGLVRVSYVFCSTQKPGVIVYDNKRFRARVLNIGEAPRPGLIDSHIEYWAACHNRIVSVADVESGALAKSAKELGYHEVQAKHTRRKFRTKKKAFKFFGL